MVKRRNYNLLNWGQVGQVGTVLGFPSSNYFYNVEDRLERVEDGSGTVIATYYYDPRGRRLKKDVNNEVIYYLYSDEGLILELNDSGVDLKTYGYKPDSTWMTDPVFMKEGDNYYYYQNDHLGTPNIIIDRNGYVIWSIKYKVFNEAEVDEDPDSNGTRRASRDGS